MLLFDGVIQKLLLKNWLLIIGRIVPGGYFHGVTSMTYGVDIERIRLFGILQVNYFSVRCIYLYFRVDFNQDFDNTTPRNYLLLHFLLPFLFEVCAII